MTVIDDPRGTPVPQSGEILPPAPRPVARPTDPEGLERYADIAPYVRAGLIAIVLLFGSFALWSLAAPLATGAIASGVLSVESSRKTIQHLEGGIIREILVRDGQKVAAGDVLMVLESSRADANLGVVVDRLAAARSLLVRLEAQRDEVETLVFPPDLVEAAVQDPELATFMATQQAAFDGQRETLVNRRRIYGEQVGQLREQIGGLAAQIAAYEEQRRLIAEEIADVEFLYDKGLVERPRLRALQRNEAALAGEIEQSRAAIAQAQQRIAEIELQRVDLDNAYRERVVNELREAQEQVAGFTDEMGAARDVVDRLEVRAPEEGTVMGRRFHTVGGVVRPGEPLLDLVPDTDSLIVTAQVAPQHIDSVHAGLPAEVILSALSTRSVPHLRAEVTRVSADRIVDERTGMSYYEAKVRIDPDEIQREIIDKNHVLYPGMPAEVVIKTGQRSAFDYFVRPISDAARRAFVAE